MAEENGHPPGLMALLNRLARTGVEVLRNRGELIAIEIQEEKARWAEVLFLAGIMVFAGFLGLVLLTLIIIYLFPADLRLYAALGFVVVYFAAAIWAALALKSALQRAPFDESLRQLKKDRQWLESLK
jgi:uncharacterized membrane protein YqjE